MDPTFERLRQSGYCIKPGYLAREEPAYFDDILTATDSIVHQPDVYRFAGFLAKRFGCRNIIDLGCGAGNKLTELASDFRIVGVDFGENVRRFREAHPSAIAMEHNFAEQVLRIEDRELVRESLVVCSDIIEHLIDPVPLLATLQDLLDDARIAIVTTPERDLVRGIEDPGPPGNVHHIREWSLPELERLLRGAGLNVEFAGLTVNNNRDWAKRTSILVLRQKGNEEWLSAPPNFRVVAFMCVYNEEDIIEPVLRHVTSQGVEVHLVDNWSTDRTVERAAAFLGRGVSRITKYPADGPSASYDWHALLTHLEQLSHATDADWCIHYDADEIRESPWPQVRLRDALFRVDREGFNAVDHTCMIFHPTKNGIEDPAVIPSYRSFEFGKRPGHFLQIKAWKRQSQPVHLAESGGHEAEFAGRRVYPYKFLLRHYPVRSQEHGIRKILADRQPRWNSGERESRGWHIQYDHVAASHNFLMNAADLPSFNPKTFYRDYLVERLTGIGSERT
ncbi:MAG: glycosyltransferase family 2 protein [Candidatus Korobacteraceae bacterium]